MTRTLIAGFGNVLRGDDGFGVEVLRRLGERGIASPSIELLDVGTGGIRLAQELLTPYDRLIIIDATTRGGAPGTVYTLAIDGVQPTREIDMHTAVPSRALEVAKALGSLPAEILLVGCEPESVDEFAIGLSHAVGLAADVAVQRIEELLGVSGTPPDVAAQLARSEEHPMDKGMSSDGIARRDELLELLYWLEGEGFHGSATLAAIVRFVAHSEPDVRRTLDHLMERGDVVLDDASGQYRLTVPGKREAGRRFAEEFAPLLGQGHGECSDPNCDCHTNPGGAAECHAARAHGGHQH